MSEIFSGANELLTVNNLVCDYETAEGKRLQAVAGVDLQVFEGETLGLVGESGCGKSTISKAVMRIIEPSGGGIRFGGRDLLRLDRRELRQLRRQLQMVFHDPVASLNPRRSCGDIVAEPLRINKTEIRTRVAQALEMVGFDPKVIWNRKPHQLSSGQCQRISLARAMISEPRFLLCDEPVSSLDVSVQAQILNLLDDMKQRYGLTMLFISHDLSVIRQMSDRAAVMYLGKLCEVAPAEQLFARPAHPYTAALLQCVPRIDQPMNYHEDQGTLKGEVPSPTDPPTGCRFRSRCPRAQARCAEQIPKLRSIVGSQQVACHYPLVASDRQQATMSNT